jgi:alpha-D-xyloside xylohydrolase
MLPLPQEPVWSKVPPVAATGPASAREDGCFAVPTSEGQLLVTPLADGVRLRLGRTDLPGYGILVAEPAPMAARLTEGADGITLAWVGFTLVLGREPLTFRLEKDGRLVQRSAWDGHFVREHRLPPFARRAEGGWFAALDLASGEPVYGLGEKWGRLDKRGQLVRSEVFDALGVNGERAYKNTPFAWSPGAVGRSGWGLFVHTPATVTHAVGFALWSQRSYGLVVEDEALDLFVTAGQDGAALIKAYTDLTGRAPMPPYR